MHTLSHYLFVPKDLTNRWIDMVILYKVASRKGYNNLQEKSLLEKKPPPPQEKKIFSYSSLIFKTKIETKGGRVTPPRL